ncbi:MAG: hypothetical protein F4Z01_06880 [Gammaproteobacteria bacterium]|nr:hypothetical protein [Gammaproteobacteria bacterium]
MIDKKTPTVHCATPRLNWRWIQELYSHSDGMIGKDLGSVIRQVGIFDWVRYAVGTQANIRRLAMRGGKRNRRLERLLGIA